MEHKANIRGLAFLLAQSYVRKHAIDFDAETQPFVNPASPLNGTATCEGDRLTARWQQAEGARGDDLPLLLLYDSRHFHYFQEIGTER